MRKALSVAGLLLLASAGLLTYRSTRAADARAEKPRNVDARELVMEVERLKAELQALSARRVHEVRPPTAPAAVSATVATFEPAKGPKLRLKDVLSNLPSEQREAYVHRLEKLETRRRVELTEAEVALERRDPTLQAHVEAEAAAALSALDASQFPTTRIRSIECGSTLCKIEVDQASSAEHQAFGGSFSMDRRTFAVRRGGEQDDAGQDRGWTLFVTTPGRRLPRPDLEELVALLPPETQGTSR